MERELILEKTRVMNAVIGYGKDIPRDNLRSRSGIQALREAKVPQQTRQRL